MRHEGIKMRAIYSARALCDFVARIMHSIESRQSLRRCGRIIFVREKVIRFGAKNASSTMVGKERSQQDGKNALRVIWPLLQIQYPPLVYRYINPGLCSLSVFFSSFRSPAHIVSGSRRILAAMCYTIKHIRWQRQYSSLGTADSTEVTYSGRHTFALKNAYSMYTCTRARDHIWSLVWT